MTDSNAVTPAFVTSPRAHEVNCFFRISTVVLSVHIRTAPYPSPPLLPTASSSIVGLMPVDGPSGTARALNKLCVLNVRALLRRLPPTTAQASADGLFAVIHLLTKLLPVSAGCCTEWTTLDEFAFSCVWFSLLRLYNTLITTQTNHACWNTRPNSPDLNFTCECFSVSTIISSVSARMCSTNRVPGSRRTSRSAIASNSFPAPRMRRGKSNKYNSV